MAEEEPGGAAAQGPGGAADGRPGEGAPADAEGRDDLIPVRMVVQYAYCRRLGYLEHVQGEFVHNEFTVDGRFKHRNVDRPAGQRRMAEEAAARGGEGDSAASASAGRDGAEGGDNSSGSGGKDRGPDRSSG